MSPALTAELEAIRDRNEWAMATMLLERSVRELYRYAFVEPSAVRYAAGVEAAVSYFARHLDIVIPELRFFVPESCAENGYARRWGCRDWETFGYHSQIRGLCLRQLDEDRAQVFIRADLRDEWDAIAVTVHEVRHAAQPWDMPPAEAEHDANDYAEAKTGRRPGGQR